MNIERLRIKYQSKIMKANSQKTVIIAFGLLSIAVFFVVVLWYAIYFKSYPLGGTESWGQFGDYLGGTLSSAFGLFTFLALLWTIDNQSEQLKVSKNELELTREELKRSADAQREIASNLVQQVKLATLSAEISATAAAIEATNQQIIFRRSQSAGAILELIDEGGLISRHKALNKNLNDLLNNIKQKEQNALK